MAGRKQWVAAAMLVASTAHARPAAPAPCSGATLVSDVAALPPAWRRALAALVEATEQPGHPWSCTGARVTLRLEAPDGPALLGVAIAGGPALERSIAAPDEVVPVGEALLAMPLPRPAPPAEGSPEPPAPLPEDRRAETRSRAEDRGEPRLLLDVLGSTRYSGATIWIGGAVRASLPFEHWALGFWGRFDAAVAELRPVPFDFIMWSGSVGLSGGHRFTVRRVEILAALEPSVAIVNMDGGLDSSPMSATGAKADLRLGSRVQGAIPLGDRWRALVAIDGEIAPLSLASDRHRMLDPRLPMMPTFTLGASLGGELVLR